MSVKKDTLGSNWAELGLSWKIFYSKVVILPAGFGFSKDIVLIDKKLTLWIEFDGFLLSINDKMFWLPTVNGTTKSQANLGTNVVR